MQKFITRTRSGFTLLEVLLVVAILATLVMIAYPRFSTPAANQELDQLTNELAADLRYMQQLSTNAGNNPTRYQIQFDSVDPTRYTLLDTADNSILKIKQIDSDKFRVSSNRMIITYDAINFNNNQAGQILTTSLATTQYKYIIISPGTGRVRVAQTNVLEPGE